MLQRKFRSPVLRISYSGPICLFYRVTSVCFSRWPGTSTAALAGGCPSLCFLSCATETGPACQWQAWKAFSHWGQGGGHFVPRAVGRRSADARWVNEWTKANKLTHSDQFWVQVSSVIKRESRLPTILDIIIDMTASWGILKVQPLFFFFLNWDITDMALYLLVYDITTWYMYTLQNDCQN